MNIFDLVDPEFNGAMSSDEIWYAGESNICLTDVVDAKSDYDHTHDGYAASNHTHSGYASQSDLELLEDVVDTKADSTHTHSEYAQASHVHSDYVLQTDFDALESEVDGKASASHSHSEYAPTSHTHSEYSAVNHDHDEDYAAIGHTHSNYATTTALSELSSTVSGKADASHSHNDVYYTETEIDAKLATKAASSHTHTGVYDASGAAASALTSANAYTDSKIDALVGDGASTTLDTIGEISSAIEDNQDAIDLLNSAIGTKANASALTAHTSNTSNPHNVTLSQLGVSATADELNYVDGVTSNIQTQLNAKAASSHTHSYAGSSSAGGAATSANKLNTNAGSATQPVYFANGVPVATTYTLGKSVPSNAVFTDTTYSDATTSAAGLMSASDKSKLDGIASGANAYTLPSAGSALGGVKTGGDVTISAGVITVNDDSHNHVISNVDGLQAALDAKSATSHTHTAEAIVAMAEALFGTNYLGGVEYSYGSGSGKNALTEISNMPQGFHTIYSIAGTTGNPETTESYRYFIHKTSSTIGWILAFGADGSIYSNYQSAAGTFKGWRTIHDTKRKPLWSSARYMTAGHTVTPSKKLSQCEHGWMLLWSDYDPDTATINNTDFCTTMIPNRNWAGSTWNGSSYYCDVPRYSAGTATDSESRVIKVLTVYDDKLVGNDNNSAAPRNDVVLRAVFEF